MSNQKKISVNIDGTVLPSFLELKLEQSINCHHSFELLLDIGTAEAENAHTLEKSKDWVGKKTIIDFDGSLFVGIVMQMGLLHIPNNILLQISGCSSTILLESGPNNASWCNKTLAAIVKETGEKAGIPMLVSPEYTSKIDYECQYGESNFDFIRRLARQYREWLYYDGRRLVFGKPELPSPIKLTYDKELYTLNICTQALAHPTRSYSYHSADNRTYNASSPDTPKGLNMLGQTAFNASLSLFKNPSIRHAEPRIATKSELDTHLQKVQQSEAALSHYITGTSDCDTLTVGSVIDVQTTIQSLNSAPDPKDNTKEQLLGSYIITNISHGVSKTDDYHNSFTAILASVPALPAPNVALPVAQMQQATVSDNDDPKKQGRVQVKMNWQTSGMHTSWLRVLTPDAGSSDKVSANRGFVFIPEIGDQVLVGFRYDDPNRPFVLGSIFHGQSGTGGGSGNKTKSLTTRSGCTIMLDDEKGSVTMNDKNGNSYAADGEGNITISASQSIKLCVGDTTFTLDKDGNIHSKGKNISADAAEKLSQSAPDIESKAENSNNISGNTVSADGKDSVSITGRTKATVDSTGTTTISGTIIKVN